ncbi:hypothetical protein HYFRA_00010216 [Hymenoscyphus fraxineus]|uniref:Uncharacterized protein n=1 Tax=Hymenoscyphus fraxineus TaxID=746836 RepID=A0A9N9PNG1_9HELO|nr:hypothetical protein HYFRA_00010216 [Hymenoscyphus fraxineus]
MKLPKFPQTEAEKKFAIAKLKVFILAAAPPTLVMLAAWKSPLSKKLQERSKLDLEIRKLERGREGGKVQSGKKVDGRKGEGGK